MTNADIWVLPAVAGAVGLVMLSVPLAVAAMANHREMAVLQAWIASLVQPASLGDQRRSAADGQVSAATSPSPDRRLTTGRPYDP